MKTSLQIPGLTSFQPTSTAKKSIKMKFSADKIYYNFSQENSKIFTNMSQDFHRRKGHFNTQKVNLMISYMAYVLYIFIKLLLERTKTMFNQLIIKKFSLSINVGEVLI